MSIEPEQCRAARALIGWSQSHLAASANVARKTIADFEQGAVKPYPRTLRDIVAAFEASGVEFIAAQPGISGPGVRLKWTGPMPHSAAGTPPAPPLLPDITKHSILGDPETE